MILSLSEIDKLSQELQELYPSGGIILLQGDLASGKTTFVKNFTKFIGLSCEVSSPTFSIMNSYDDKIFHYDIYNNSTTKFIESGLLENLELEGYHFIEWADEKFEEILKTYGFRYTTINITPTNDNKREYKLCTN
ncbi:MAG TPA: tRNA (adenosine(37)-N6)-threonylcarbamoyltransferase complex ATPase subunit type 1 TsaE [Campylobacterales bacterium]|nr:tRNA (adenosine(37)-N6)-threonylcarbamoyltransferase complex ATPase subunit type 1 TsaE [Campylobacterales bacterium]